MKVLNVSVNDYANFSHDNAKALRSIGVDCVDLKTHKHSFNYPSQSTIANRNAIITEMIASDIIQIFHTDTTLLEWAKGLGKKVIMYHTGTRYRRKPEYYNSVINPYVDLCINALPEFMGLGAKSERYLVGAVDVPPYKEYEITKPYTIAQYPS